MSKGSFPDLFRFSFSIFRMFLIKTLIGVVVKNQEKSGNVPELRYALKKSETKERLHN